MPLGIAFLQEAVAEAPLRSVRRWLRAAEARGDEISARIYRHEISLRTEDVDVRSDLRHARTPYIDQETPGLGCSY